MATTVREVMNRELFCLRPGDRAGDALTGILALGITGAPVVDAEGCPLGMVSLRDLAGHRATDSVADLMSAPATVVDAAASLDEAGGRILARTGFHRLPAVDEDGKLVGLVSALDILRGLLGLPAVHPPAFPHLDLATRLVWSDDQALEPGSVAAAPPGPGLLALSHGGAGQPERLVWAEATDDVRVRLQALLDVPGEQEPHLAWWLARGTLRFRAASAPDCAGRRAALEALLHEARLSTRLPAI
jgi:CBS domain-containing protein